jgi:uncharacterized membrane protein YraQ (UPF0718 family)
MSANSTQHTGGWGKLIKSAIIYIVLALVVWGITKFFSPAGGKEVAGTVYKTFSGVISIIFAIFALIGLIQVWLTSEQISKVLGKEAGWKGLVLSALLPMILGGSLFVIFPLLKALREKGARTSAVITFLFAWSAKAPLLPLEIKFVGWHFAVLRLVLIPVISIIGGLTAEWFIEMPLRKKPP